MSIVSHRGPRLILKLHSAIDVCMYLWLGICVYGCVCVALCMCASVCSAFYSKAAFV